MYVILEREEEFWVGQLIICFVYGFHKDMEGYITKSLLQFIAYLIENKLGYGTTFLSARGGWIFFYPLSLFPLSI